MIEIPQYAETLLSPMRYKVLYGGRGSGKSYTIARLLLSEGIRKKKRVLCAREYQNSISDSVHKLLTEQIHVLGFSRLYDYNDHSITGKNGTEFVFKGIRNNVNSIRSMVGLTDVWIEEAQSISQNSWDVLIPTVRESGSEIWASFNPDSQDDPTFKMFCNPDGSPKKRDDAFVINVNWYDNPWFPDILRKEKDELYKTNPELAEHVWGGECRSHSDAQIFKNKWVVREFERQAHYDGPYFGADWGFSIDPCALVKIYLDVPKRELLFRNAVFTRGREAELQNIKYTWQQVPESQKYIIRADSSRPETIQFMCREGFNVLPAEKWHGSVEDGIEWLKTWTIVIHPDCESGIIENQNRIPYGLITESKNYSYKVDRLTQDVLTDMVDSYNHGFDAARYALEPMIKTGIGSFQVL